MNFQNFRHTNRKLPSTPLSAVCYRGHLHLEEVGVDVEDVLRVGLLAWGTAEGLMMEETEETRLRRQRRKEME